MLKKWKICAAALALGGLLCSPLSGGAAENDAKFTGLSFMGGYLESHPTTQEVFIPFMKAAEKQFDGKLSFRYFSTNALYSEAEAYSALSDGRADIGMVRPSLFPTKMRLLGVVSLPGMCPNAVVGSFVTEELIRKFPEVRAELPRNTEHFTSWASAPYQLHTLTPIRTREDLKGKRIAVWDSTSLAFVEALGAHGIRMSSPDTFLALSRGMVDGVLCPLAPLRSYKISDETRYHLIIGIGVDPFTAEINKKVWDAMPKDMKTWISSQGGTVMAEACGRSLENSAMAEVKWMKEQGHEFTVLSGEERAAFLDPLNVFVERWKTEVCKGLDPKLVDEVYKYAVERSKYHTEQMNAGKYGDFNI